MIVQWLLVTAVLILNLAVIPFFLYLLVISIAAICPRAKKHQSTGARTRFLVVIPAHDEEPVISTAVRSCLAAQYPRSRFSVLVIADNCSDQTATVAASAGARVVARFDEAKRSKGYAIEYLIETLERSGELDSFDAIVIVDADTTIDPELLLHFDRALAGSHDWSQAYYTVANPDESWRTRLLKYAFSLFNGVVPLGQTRLGASTTFKGNGMCLSVPGLRRIPWRCYGLVEDMEYAWTLRIAGERIAFLPDVSVYGAMPGRGGDSAATQRRRWEFGRSETRNKYLGPLLRSQRVGWWPKLLALGELTVPPMAVLAVIYITALVADCSILLALQPGSNAAVRAFLLGCLCLFTASLGVYAVSPFLALRLAWKYALAIALFPLYSIWRFWISLKGRPDRWVRTRRQPPREEQQARTDEASLSR
jgi:cellulose synthase/poly-beta-1,6-N-acetylglucosamine synthase-like glycosyltransferase